MMFMNEEIITIHVQCLGLKFGTLSNISAHDIKGLEKKELDKRRRWRE